MKITYLTSKFPLLSETFIYEELLALQKLGHQVDMFVFYNTGKKSHKYTDEVEQLVTYLPNIFSNEHLRAQVHFLRSHFKKYRTALTEIIRETWRSPKLLGKSLYAYSKGILLAYQLLDHPPDHLHAHWATMPTSAVHTAGHFLEIPYSFTSHAWDIYKQPLMLSKKFEKAAFAVTISEYNKRFLSDQYSGADEKTFVVRCGINLERFKYVTAQNDVNPPNILFVGRLIEKKGAEILIQACSQLKKGGFAFQCIIVGDGPLQPELEKQVQRLDLVEEVLFTGGLDQDSLMAYWQTASVFVLPCLVAANNDRDGIPVALMEAMALGLPVISTTVSGIPELIENRISGLLVPPGDSTELAEAVIQILSDKDQAIVYARRARVKIEREYNITQNALQKAELFESKLDKRG
jgi:glycosyltransferase involved in cell wall biosynthesis